MQNNRWRKRGLSLVPVRFGLEWGWGTPYTVHVNIYAADGTVAICHGGIEVGQGINTKVSHSSGVTPVLLIVSGPQTLFHQEGRKEGKVELCIR